MEAVRTSATAEPLRYTFPPCIHTPVLIEAPPGAICTLRQHGDSVAGPSLKAFAGPDGYARFHLRPSWACEQIAKLMVEIVKDGKRTTRELHVRSSHEATPDAPAPQTESALAQHPSGRMRPPLSIDDALRLSDEQTLDRGYPPRPNRDEAPAAFRARLRAVSLPMMSVEPHLIANEAKSHGKSRMAGPATSGNWSGFELDRSLRLTSLRPPHVSLSDPYDWVAGEWIVPAVTGESNKSTYSAFWVGLDGDGLTDLVQAGTEQECTNFNFWFINITSTTYYAWTEFLPQQPIEQVISGLTVNPGDQIFTEVWMGNAGSSPTLSGVFGIFLVMNLTTGTYSQIYTPVGSTSVSGSEAVWIMERPTVGGALPDLANYGTALMFNASARKANASGGQGYIAYQGARNKQISMINGSDTLSSVTPVTASSMLFTWQHFS
jgi:hypothetical protein